MSAVTEQIEFARGAVVVVVDVVVVVVDDAVPGPVAAPASAWTREKPRATNTEKRSAREHAMEVVRRNRLREVIVFSSSTLSK